MPEEIWVGSDFGGRIGNRPVKPVRPVLRDADCNKCTAGEFPNHTTTVRRSTGVTCGGLASTVKVSPIPFGHVGRKTRSKPTRRVRGGSQLRSLKEAPGWWGNQRSSPLILPMMGGYHDFACTRVVGYRRSGLIPVQFWWRRLR